MYVNPTSITNVRFPKPCKAISGSLALCDGVLLSFSVASVKPAGPGQRIPTRYFHGFELRK